MIFLGFVFLIAPLPPCTFFLPTPLNTLVVCVIAKALVRLSSLFKADNNLVTRMSKIALLLTDNCVYLFEVKTHSHSVAR